MRIPVYVMKQDWKGNDYPLPGDLGLLLLPPDEDPLGDGDELPESLLWGGGL